MYKIVSKADGKPISRIAIRSGVDEIGCIIGDVTPAYFVEHDENSPILFNYIEQCYALLSFLSFVGFEVLEFDIFYTEEFV